MIDFFFGPWLLPFEVVLKDLQGSALIIQEVRETLFEIFLHISVLRRDVETHTFAGENNKEFFVRTSMATIKDRVG